MLFKHVRLTPRTVYWLHIQSSQSESSVWTNYPVHMFGWLGPCALCALVLSTANCMLHYYIGGGRCREQGEGHKLACVGL